MTDYNSVQYFILIIYSPDKICDNLTGPGLSRKPGDSFCFVDVENYFLKTEVLDQTLEMRVLYDVLSENDLYEILSTIKESSSCL